MFCFQFQVRNHRCWDLKQLMTSPPSPGAEINERMLSCLLLLSSESNASTFRQSGIFCPGKGKQGLKKWFSSSEQAALPEDPGCFQHPHDDSQQSVTLVPRDRAPSSGLCGHCMKVPHRLICRVKSHTLKKIKTKKLNIKVTVSLWARCGGICL